MDESALNLSTLQQHLSIVKRSQQQTLSAAAPGDKPPTQPRQASGNICMGDGVEGVVRQGGSLGQADNQTHRCMHWFPGGSRWTCFRRDLPRHPTTSLVYPPFCSSGPPLLPKLTSRACGQAAGLVTDIDHTTTGWLQPAVQGQQQRPRASADPPRGTGDEKRVYEYIARRYLACCSKDVEQYLNGQGGGPGGPGGGGGGGGGGNDEDGEVVEAEAEVGQEGGDGVRRPQLLQSSLSTTWMTTMHLCQQVQQERAH
ncbi:hypothetical protein D9619_009847 [Psilocybe cf. subviscida]|uniref:Uncharacterized protein n=1 Tax=Psilocybe cf. subviscida TaxID=2480587 RepID=A0A8H5BLZ1_9AGAR|nr:hypothetical protein D9619_009847 [Psilocybe cf. subviscida]